MLATCIIPIMMILQQVSSISLVVHALHMLDCMTLHAHYTIAFKSTLLLVIHSPFLTPTLLLPIPCNGTMSSTRHQQSSSLWVLVLCHYALHSSCDITWSHVSWEISHCWDHPHCLHASHKVPWSDGWSNAWLSIHFSSLWKTLSSLTQVSFVSYLLTFWSISVYLWCTPFSSPRTALRIDILIHFRMQMFVNAVEGWMNMRELGLNLDEQC